MNFNAGDAPKNDHRVVQPGARKGAALDKTAYTACLIIISNCKS